MNLFVLLNTFYVILFCTVAGAQQCIDEDGNPVDWYVAYKMPHIHQRHRKFKSLGVEYMYMTSKTVKQGWQMSTKHITDQGTAFANTLKPYYLDPKKGLWLLYNDQGPEAKEGGGHTKGVLGAGKESGFWLVHSVPHFAPTSKQGYSFPSTGLKNGQSFLCVSLPPKSMDAVGKFLMYNSPDVYDFECEDGLLPMYPDIVAASNGTRIENPPYYKFDKLISLENTEFTVFAKSGKFGKDLYQLVANQLETDLLCETWLNERGALPSDCSIQYKVYNIKTIFVNGTYNFSSGKDHSKWAVSPDKPWICIGDINRATPQEKRGGGTVCLNNELLSHQYRSLVKETEACQIPNFNTILNYKQK